MSLVKLLNFQLLADGRGSLIALEGQANIPFEIKRVYYLFGMPQDIARGFHAHRNLKQVLICMAGSCTVIVDNGKERESVLLTKPDQGLFIDGMIWREMNNFTADCVLTVLASEHYDEADYIREYETFLELI